MKSLNNPFFLIHAGMILVLLPFLFIYTQMEITLWVNQFQNSVLDFICNLFTYAGDGWVVVVTGIILLFFHPRLALNLLLAYSISALIAQGLKHLVFADMHRPLWHLEEMKNTVFRLPANAEMSYNNSFPSGHTTSAFAMFASIALYLKSNELKSLCFVMALFTAFTRIYLLQHFLPDALVGSIIGSLTAILVYEQLLLKGRMNFILKYFNA